jgi:uncharacterized protein GlcG (DUF336 family)
VVELLKVVDGGGHVLGVRRHEEALPVLLPPAEELAERDLAVAVGVEQLQDQRPVLGRQRVAHVVAQRPELRRRDRAGGVGIVATEGGARVLHHVVHHAVHVRRLGPRRRPLGAN